MSLRRLNNNIYLAEETPPPGLVGELLQKFQAQVVIGHPTFHNAATIGAEISRGIRAAIHAYAGQKVGFVVSDGTRTAATPDSSTLTAAVAGAQSSLALLPPAKRHHIIVVVTPYEGYRGNRIPGKGSAIKLIFDELALVPTARKLILLDGDLRNDLGPWLAVFARVESEHQSRSQKREFFITARYARHFVDASLSRFVVGPLTTLMGCYVPGGISGDIVLSAGAVRHEREASWDEPRYRYGTDIATTFDNIADPEVEIYEVYLGAKLHDITDEAKLAVMPGEVIGEALSRMLYYEKKEGRISRQISAGTTLARPVSWGPDLTGIGFLDPGYTEIFDVDVKRKTLVDKFPLYARSMEAVLDPPTWRTVSAAHARLGRCGGGDQEPFIFLDLGRQLWLEVLYQAVAQVLSSCEVEAAKQCLNYLYTAAFLEFCREKIMELGARTLGDVRRMQRSLGVPADEAERFYRDRVDAVVEQMAMDFFADRGRIAVHLKSTSKGHR